MNNLEEFKQSKISGRAKIHQAAIDQLKALDPVAIHQFGSGGRSSGDEFSDIDLFTTLADDQFEKVTAQRRDIYQRIAPILVHQRHQLPNPAGWYHDLIIHQTPAGLFHVDYYLTPESKSLLPPNAALLHGQHQPQGEWETWTIKGHDEPASAELKLESLLAMSFIGIKGSVRGWHGEFYDYIRQLYQHYQRLTEQTLPELPADDGLPLVYAVLNNLQSEGTPEQQFANRQIADYARQVEQLYLS